MYGAVEEPLLRGSSKGYNPDFGSWLESPTEGRYTRTEDDKTIGIVPCDGENKRIYKFHKKTGLGVVVVIDEEGHVTVKFIG